MISAWFRYILPGSESASSCSAGDGAIGRRRPLRLPRCPPRRFKAHRPVGGTAVRRLRQGGAVGLELLARHETLPERGPVLPPAPGVEAGGRRARARRRSNPHGAI